MKTNILNSSKKVEIIYQLKSVHPCYLNEYVSVVLKRLVDLKNINCQQVFLPRRYERFTVLRSPHVDKKARDQAEKVTYKRLLKITLLTSEYNMKKDRVAIREIMDSAIAGL